MQGLQGYAEICRDMQGYSCTRLHNLNRPSERDKEGRERELCGTATCSCYVSKLQLPRDGSEMAQLLSWSRTGWTCLLQTAAILHSVHWSLLVCGLLTTAFWHLPPATCRMPHAALRVHQQQFINLFTSSRRQLPHNQSIGGAWTGPGMGVAWR